MNNEKAITTNPDADDYDALGSRKEIDALARRIKTMIPGGGELGTNEALALAQISHVTGLNPFIGEIWYIPGKGPMVGIRGARHVADDTIKEEGGQGAFYSLDFVVTDAADAGAPDVDRYGKPVTVLHAYKVILRDSVSTKEYLKNFETTIRILNEAKHPRPFDEAKKMLGDVPVWIGYGYSSREEKTRMSKKRAALKRGEAMALQGRFSIPFGGKVAGADDFSEADSGSYQEAAGPGEKATPVKAEPIVEGEILEDDIDNREWSESIIKMLIEAAVVMDEDDALEVLSHSLLDPKNDGPEIILKWGKTWRAARDEDFSGYASANKANNSYKRAKLQ